MRFKHIFAGFLLFTSIFFLPVSLRAAETAPTTAADTDTAQPDNGVRIPDGVYAENISLSGLTQTEAQEAINDYYQNVGSSAFTVDVNGQKVQTTLNDLGFTYDTTGLVEEASRLGQYGGLIQRYKTLMDLKFDKVTLEITHSVDQTLVSNFVAEQIAVLDTEPKNATITRESGSFVVTPHTTGLVTDQETTVQTILTAVTGQLAANMEVQATVEVATPYRTAEALSTISTLLGYYETDYGDSASGRKTNISVASNYLDGTVLMPGDSLSVSDAIKPREPENGYALGGEYVNGETVESYGGGVCQVATTLYNALLRAELQIDERHPHSMLVSYVEPSFDAAIANGAKDLQFTNNTGNPIYIESYADGATLGFNIYGTKFLPDNRSVKYESVVVSRETSETKEVYDPNQPTGYRETKGSNHDKCTSYLVKKVYVDGELTDTIQFSTDYYAASYRTVTIGTGPAETTAAETQPTESTVAPTQPAETPAPETQAPEETLPEGADPPEDESYE